MLDFRLEGATYHNAEKLVERMAQEAATEDTPPSKTADWWRKAYAVLTGILRGEVMRTEKP